MWEYTAFVYAIFWHSLSVFRYCSHWIWFTEDYSGFSLSGQTELICNCSVSIVLKSQIIPVYWTRSPLFSIWTFLLIVWFQLLCILILAIFPTLFLYLFLFYPCCIPASSLWTVCLEGTGFGSSCSHCPNLVQSVSLQTVLIFIFTQRSSVCLLFLLLKIM